MYQPTTRVLTVLELLQTYGRLSNAELAQRVEVTPRSVRRYITMLQDLGIPVESERGRYGGYRLRAGYKLPPLMFTNQEALAVTLSLLAANRLSLTGDEPATEGALAKIERVLPEAVWEQVHAVQEALILDDVPRPERVEAGTVISISKAIQQGRMIWIRYEAPRGESARAIDPYGLVFRDGAWYVVGWCHLREDIRIFRLDRIRKLRCLSSEFQKPEGFNPRQFVQQKLDEQFEDSHVELLLETSLDEARTWVTIISAKLEETPEGVLLSTSVSSLDWLAYFIVSMPWKVRVRRPKELMERLAQLSTRIASIEFEPKHEAEEVSGDRGQRSPRSMQTGFPAVHSHSSP